MKQPIKIGKRNIYFKALALYVIRNQYLCKDIFRWAIIAL